MDRNLAAPTIRKTSAEYKAEIDRLTQEILRSEAQMRSDRSKIERLRGESRAITKHTDLVLERLEKHIQALSRTA